MMESNSGVFDLALKFISCNIDGFHKKVILLLDILKEKNVDICFIQETHKYNHNMLKAVCDKYDYTLYSNCSPGFSSILWSGTAILVKFYLVERVINHHIIESNRIQSLSFAIDTADPDSQLFTCINTYLSSGDSEVGSRCLSLRKIKSFCHNRLNHFIVLGGDFNMIEHKMDTMIPENFSEKDDLIELKALKDSVGLSDIFRNLNPSKIVYTRVIKNSARRLDRFYVNEKTGCFPLNSSHISTPFSDHLRSPLLFFNCKRREKWGKGVWALNESLLTDRNKVKLQEFWSDWQYYKLNFDSVLDWWDEGKRKIKKLFKSIGVENASYQRSLEAELTQEMSQLQQNNLRINNKVLQLKEKLNNIKKIRMNGSKIRSKIISVENDERASIFKLKAAEVKNYNSKSIHSLKKDDGVFVSQKDEVLEEIHSYYKKIWYDKENITNDDIVRHLENINFPATNNDTEQNNNLDKTIYPCDCLKILKKMNKGSSPGSDGFPPRFYLWAWEILKDDLCEVYNNSYRQECLPASQKLAIVKLIPKEGAKTDLDNWRPIALLNTDYKVLAKLINEKAVEYLSPHISRQQKCAINGREMVDIHYNINAAIEEAKLRNHPLIITKYDIRKAFDRLSHEFMIKIAEYMLPDFLVKWVKIFYKDVRCCVNINGALTDTIFVRRGIRQGCPLSMTLYVMSSEPLTFNLKTCANISKCSFSNTVEQYADDTNTFVSDLLSHAISFRIINDFCLISGQQINRKKTKVLVYCPFCPVVHQHLKSQLSTNFTVVNKIKILGVWFFEDHSRLSENWDDIYSKMISAFHANKKRDVSLIGKVRLFNSLILSISNHVAKVVLPNKSCITRMNKLMFEFFWFPRKLEMLSRKKLTAPKDKGGIGLYDLEQRWKLQYAFRLKKMFVLNEFPQSEIEPWQDWCIYQLGTKLVPMLPNLYTNSIPHAFSPNASWLSILNTYKETAQTFSSWLDKEFKVLYHGKMMTLYNLNYAPYNRDWSQILLSKSLHVSFFTNWEKQFSYLVGHDAYKWGSWKSRNWSTTSSHISSLDNTCKFCKSMQDDVSHVFLDCPVVNRVYSNLMLFLQAMCEDPDIPTADVILYNKSEHCSTLKLLSITKFHIIRQKEKFDALNKHVENQNIFIDSLTNSIITDFKTFIINACIKFGKDTIFKKFLLSQSANCYVCY